MDTVFMTRTQLSSLHYLLRFDFVKKQQLCNFTPFVVWVDGFLGVEAEATLNHIVRWLEKNIIRPTHGRAAMLRVGWPSPWSMQTTISSRDPRYQRTRSVCSNRSGRMRPSYTPLVKEKAENKNQDKKFPSLPQRRDSKKVDT